MQAVAADTASPAVALAGIRDLLTADVKLTLTSFLLRLDAQVLRP
jgi:hypothetical protein